MMDTGYFSILFLQPPRVYNYFKIKSSKNTLKISSVFLGDKGWEEWVKRVDKDKVLNN